MTDQVKNALIAVFVFAAFGIFAFIIVFLQPRVGDEEQILRVRFSNVDKVTTGTRVTFAGRPVGEVVEIRDIEVPRQEQLHGGYIYSYELVLNIDSGVKVFNTDEVSLRTSGLLGERTISITPRYPKKGQKVKIITENDVLFATETGSLEETFAGFGEFAQKAEDAFDAINAQLKEIDKEELWKHVGETARNLSEITGALNEPNEWTKILKNVSKFTDKINELGDQFGGTLNSADEMFDNLIVSSEQLVDITDKGVHTMENVDKVAEDIANGRGTIGRLVGTDDLYLRTTSLFSKAETILDDINHYGILFQNDKGWQRLRARRRNLLNCLRTPQQFRNFFQDEINEISTSLSRVYTVLRKTECMCPPECLLADPCFASLFADLLRRIEGLEENIMNYNQQLIDYTYDPCYRPGRCPTQLCQ